MCAHIDALLYRLVTGRFNRLQRWVYKPTNPLFKKVLLGWRSKATSTGQGGPDYKSSTIMCFISQSSIRFIDVLASRSVENYETE